MGVLVLVVILALVLELVLVLVLILVLVLVLVLVRVVVRVVVSIGVNNVARQCNCCNNRDDPHHGTRNHVGIPDQERAAHLSISRTQSSLGKGQLP